MNSSVEELGTEYERIQVRLLSVMPRVEPSETSEKEALRFVDPVEQVDVQVPESEKFFDRFEDAPVLDVEADENTLALEPEKTDAVSLGASVDAVPYWEGVRASIARRAKYPRVAQQRRLEGTVKLSIVIDRQGELIRVEAVSPYVHEVLTQAALRAVRRAAPFTWPDFDRSGRDRFRAELPVHFKLGV